MSAPPLEEMPRIRTAFTRGLAGTWSSPLIVGALIGWLLVEWIVIVALGYPGPIALLAHVSAPIPISTITDISISTGILGVPSGLVFVFVVAGVHALWYAALTGLAIETLETGSATRWGAVRGLRAFPVTFALHVIGVAVLFTSQVIVAVGGAGLAVFLQIAVIVLVVWAFAFAPVIAIAERGRLMECLARSIRTARLPGSSNLTLAALYVVPVFATFLSPQVPGAFLDVNPPFTAWVFVVLLNLLHIAVLGAFAMRYLAVAHLVPDAPARTAPADRGDRRAARRGRSR